MNREEILAKSRQEGIDEGLIAAENQGRKIAITVFTLIFGLIAIFDFFNGQSNPEVYALYFAFIAAEAYPKYRFTLQSGYIVLAIGGAIACIGFLAMYLLQVLR